MVLGLDKRALWAALPLLGFAIGHFLDLKETERMSMFRDKSALYARPAGSEDKPPSWWLALSLHSTIYVNIFFLSLSSK